MRIKNEAIYARLADSNAEPTDEGRRQFHAHQSAGLKPAVADPYFLRLCSGKQRADIQTEEYRSLYGTNEWFGWHAIAQDFKDDEQAYNFYFSWHQDRPTFGQLVALLNG